MPGRDVVDVFTIHLVEKADHCCFQTLPRYFSFWVVFSPAELVAHAVEFIPNIIRPVVFEVGVVSEEVVDVISSLGHVEGEVVLALQVRAQPVKGERGKRRLLLQILPGHARSDDAAHVG